uniref:Nuclear egress membrane protein n=1 Tax=Hipposideros bat herpesvirus TaxID=3141919 RepID=A0AAU7E1S4_9VIRU
MVSLDKSTHNDLIAMTRRILRLGDNELRVTENSLICKNPNYSLCDAMLKTDVVYCVEYLMSYWECKTGSVPFFVFKNSGSAVSLCCYVKAPPKLVGLGHVGEFNSLKVNESLVVAVCDIERVKPSARGVLTNCVVRRSMDGSAYNIEFVAFGPESESEYNSLLREMYMKKKRMSAVSSQRDGCRRASVDRGRGRLGPPRCKDPGDVFRSTSLNRRRSRSLSPSPRNDGCRGRRPVRDVFSGGSSDVQVRSRITSVPFARYAPRIAAVTVAFAGVALVCVLWRYVFV